MRPLRSSPVVAVTRHPVRTGTALLAVLAAAVMIHSASAQDAIPAKPPVLLLVFDEWPVDSLLGPDGRIDAGRYPNLAAFAGTATWYANATTVYDSTTKAVPEILDGKLPRAHSRPNYRDHPRSVFDLFGKRGYRITRQEAATSVCPPRWCRGARLGRPAILPQLQQDRVGPLRAFLDGIRAEPERFYMRHTLLPHGPYLYLPSGKQMRPGWKDPLPGMNGPAGFGSASLTQHNGQRLRLQAGLVDRELGRLFDRLKREGSFDKTLIAILPDHGIATEELGVRDRRTVTRSNISEIAPIPLFIKAPGQTAGRIDRSWVRSIDVVPTIATILDQRLPYRTDGRPASSPATRTRRHVRMIRRDFSGTITLSAKQMLARRKALRARELREYGHGDWASLYSSVGPHRDLVGRAVSHLPVGPHTRVKARFVNARLLRSVDPRSRMVPAQLAGRISGARRGARRDLAVAVNGRIEAVQRSFGLRGDRRELFAAMVPEQAFRPGRNRVELFEVSPSGKRLRSLGGA